MHRSMKAPRAKRTARRCLHAAAQPQRFQLADTGRISYDEEVVETKYKRIFKDHGMFDPPLPPQHEMFQIPRFWEELQTLSADWRRARDHVDRLRSGAETDLTGRQAEDAVATVHVLGDKVFKFFTFMRAHLDRNPRDRLRVVESRPDGLEDVYGLFMKILAAQVDFDYCPRCHLRLDGTTSVCGDPTVLSPLLYGDNHVFGFEGGETEHSFWTPSWLVEYETRAKDLWYQALQLPFFRTPEHTAVQCEALMEVYEKSLNRGEANHFMRQCQVHGLPITPRMVDCHRRILQNTNAHSLFFHGDPKAVSPRWKRYEMELEKLRAMEDEFGMIKHPPASYLPLARTDEVYGSLPETFDVAENGWVADFAEISQKLQQSADSWSPVFSQRAQSAEFPDWAYSEETLDLIDHHRSEIRKSAFLHNAPAPLKLKGKKMPLDCRVHVPGFAEVAKKEAERAYPPAQPHEVVFPTARGYEVFDTSETSFTVLKQWPSEERDSEYIKFAINPGARLRATTLAQYLEPHVPRLTHPFPICTSRGDAKSVDVQALPVVDFSTSTRAIFELLEYGSNSKGASLEQWRKNSRPWCAAKWEQLEANSKHRNLRVGSGLVPRSDGQDKGTVYVVGVHDGQLWGARNGEAFASVILASTVEDMDKYRYTNMNLWAVQQPVEAEGIVVGHKDGDVWVQWGPNRIATPMPGGNDMDEIRKIFRNLEVLPGKGVAVEPPSWYIPFRNSWREEELQAALRKPWTDQPFTAPAQHEAPLIKQQLDDPTTYHVDDYRTSEFEKRVGVRNALNGSARISNGPRFADDLIFSVNPYSNNAMHTGYGQPQVDRDELDMPLGPDDGSNDIVERWEIEETEQALRDISGRAVGASAPTVAALSPAHAVNDPLHVRKQATMQIADRGTLITDSRNPSHKSLRDLEMGQLKARLRPDRSASWEYGGYKDVGQMSVMPHERKTLLGESHVMPMHKRMHLTGKEGDYMKLNVTQAEVVGAFNAMNDFYDEMNKPFDVGHTHETTTANIDPALPHNLPSKTMSVGHKRRMAGLLLRLWMTKAEKTQTTLPQFARDHNLHRLALLSWFGGDSPASPSVLSALKSWLRPELEKLDLLDEFKIEDADTYSPVYEPGFYRWLDKSRFDYQYELLLGAKLRRFDSKRMIDMPDPLSEKQASRFGLDVKGTELLVQYEDQLMGGNVNPLNKGQIDAYDVRTAVALPRVSVHPATGKAGANINSFQTSIGFDRAFLNPKTSPLFGSVSLQEIKRAMFETLQDSIHLQQRHADVEAQRAAALEKAQLMDATAGIAFAKDWNEGLAMDMLYAIRRNAASPAQRAEFNDFLNLAEASKRIAERLDGLYEYRGGAFRITGEKVENATLDGEEWEGALERKDDGSWAAELSNDAVLTLKRHGNDTVEWTYVSDDEEVIPKIAKAKRADLDLEGTMWNLYVRGNWIPGVDEANSLVLDWTIRHADTVGWELVGTGLKAADAAFMKSALVSTDISLQFSEPKLAEDGTIGRTVRGSGDLSAVDSWATQAPHEAIHAVRIDRKAGTFSFECTQVASDVTPILDARNRPFEFESFRTELTTMVNKWARLGMDLVHGPVLVADRKGVPAYGELLEMMHWLDVLVQQMDKEIAEIDPKQEDADVHLNSLKAIQQDCAAQVLQYQKAASPNCTPVLLGNCGYDASVMKGDGTPEAAKLSTTVTLTGYHAKVLNRQLPLLAWWHKILNGLKHERTAHAQALRRVMAA